MSIAFLLIVLSIMYICFIFNKKTKLYKKDLRNVFEKEKRKKYDDILEKEFTYIYDNIIQNAKIGKTKLSFTVFCKPYEIVTNLNEDKILTSNILSEELQNMYNYSVKSLEFDFLAKLHTVFPDSNLTYHKKDDKEYYKCDYFTLSW